MLEFPSLFGPAHSFCFQGIKVRFVSLDIYIYMCVCACIILSLDLGKISEPNHDLAYSTVFDSSFEITISRR